MKLAMSWGGTEREANLQLGTIKGTKHKDPEFRVLGSVEAQIVGRSSHEHGKSEVGGFLVLNEKEVYELFAHAVRSSSMDPKLKRLATALAKELL